MYLISFQAQATCPCKAEIVPPNASRHASVCLRSSVRPAPFRCTGTCAAAAGPQLQASWTASPSNAWKIGVGSGPRALAPSCSGFTEQGLALLTGLLVCLWSMLPASQSLNPEPGVCVCDMRCGRQWGQLVLEAAEGELERAVQPLSSMAEPCGESGQHRRLACALFAAGEVSHCLRPGRHHLGAGACALPWVDPEP